MINLFMRKYFILFIMLTAVVTGCNQAAASDAQIQTAIAETAAVTATFQAAVNQAAGATITSLPPTPTPGASVDVYELTEEELASLIDESVNEALAASEEAYATTNTTTTDGTVTEAEVYATIQYVYDAEAAIAYAEDLMDYYFELYGAYASEAIDVLYAIEEDLNAISGSLAEIEVILEQGEATASAAIDQLNAAVSNAQSQLEEAQTEAATIKSQIQSSLEERENQFANLTPTEIAPDREGTLSQVFTFLDTYKGAMDDRMIRPEELSQIAQLSANAQASILQNGGPALQNLAPGINNLTHQASRGDWPGARRDLGGFEASLPSRPSRR